jgi:orotate phosphoribosyltransferase
MPERSPEDVLKLVAARKGHFVLESGHHGDLWLDLELLCRNPKQIEPLCLDLAGRLSQFKVDVVCGPLIEGAFVALFVASELHSSFVYSERFARSGKDALFPAGYRLPDSLRHIVRGKRTAIVNDVINAGSAVRGTFEDLEICGAEVVAIGTLLALGNSAQRFAEANNVALERLATFSNEVWEPPVCPLCARGVPLENPLTFW